MKTIMYIVIFAFIAYIPNFFQDKEDKVIIQEIPKTKVDSLLHIANKVERKIDKSLMNKISNKNSENDSLKQVIKRKDAEIKKLKRKLSHDK